MGVSSKHPLYIEFAQDWEQLRDTYRGERVVKEKGAKYLPPTAGMEADGVSTSAASPGFQAYKAYRARSVFPEVMSESVESMLGVMHHKPPKIELPAKLEPLLEKATLQNESLEMLLRRINEEQLVTGRLGLLLEVPEATGIVLPFIALYRAEDVINWDEGERDGPELDSLNLVVLDETEDERQADFTWERVEKYRVLILGDVDANEPVGAGAIYRAGVFREDVEFSEAGLVEPQISGGRMEQIPFVFINTKDVTPEPEEAPLLGVSNLSLTIYRGEADYRQALFMQGQDTWVEVGTTGDEGETTRLGAGAVVRVPMGGDAFFRGVESGGLSEMRSALENDYIRGKEKASGLLEAVSRSAESGEALRVRVSARTASLNQIAMAGAFALQELLKMAATWVGANPDEVIVEPNLDFVADRLPGAELVGYMTAKGLGAPLSLETIHEIAAERGLTALTFEEELERLTAEAELGMPGAVAEGDDDTGATEEGDPEDEEELFDKDGNPVEPEGEEEDDGEGKPPAKKSGGNFGKGKA